MVWLRRIVDHPKPLEDRTPRRSLRKPKAQVIDPFAPLRADFGLASTHRAIRRVTLTVLHMNIAVNNRINPPQE